MISKEQGRTPRAYETPDRRLNPVVVRPPHIAGRQLAEEVRDAGRKNLHGELHLVLADLVEILRSAAVPVRNPGCLPLSPGRHHGAKAKSQTRAGAKHVREPNTMSSERQALEGKISESQIATEWATCMIQVLLIKQ